MQINTIELMQRIIQKVKVNGHWIPEESNMPIDYYSPSYVPMQMEESDMWNESIEVSTDFGESEGIYIDVYLRFCENGVYKNGDICTIKTLSDTEEAYITYSVLAAWIKMYGNQVLREYLCEMEKGKDVMVWIYQLPWEHPVFRNSYAYFEKHFKQYFEQSYEKTIVTKVRWKGAEETLPGIYELFRGYRPNNQCSLMAGGDVIMIRHENGENQYYFTEDLKEKVVFHKIDVEVSASGRQLYDRESLVYLMDEGCWKDVTELDLRDEYFTLIDKDKDGNFTIVHLQEKMLKALPSTKKTESFEHAYEKCVEYMRTIEQMEHYQKTGQKCHVVFGIWQLKKIQEERNRQDWKIGH